jgi:S-adenosylmethionine hydrolase
MHNVAVRQRLVTLVTDYGWKGGFVGALHGVIDKIGDGTVATIDLDHEIPAHDIVLGALRMERLLAYTRPGVHVGVVDPGVGSTRLGIAIQAGERLFVGPDNGLLVFACQAAGTITRAVALERDEWFLPSRSKTFDGRDVFAPVAAHLSMGIDLGELGQAVPLESLARVERPAGPVVVQVDGFGNVQLALDGAGLARHLGTSEELANGGVTLTVSTRSGGRWRALVGTTFADVARGELVLLTDSDGAIALSVNEGRASDLLAVGPGDELQLELEA